MCFLFIPKMALTASYWIGALVAAGSLQPLQPVWAYQTGCSGPSTFRKVRFSNSELLSFAYLHRFKRFITFCLYLEKEAERKIKLVFAEGKGLEFDIPTRGQISDPGPSSRRVYFQILLLYLRRRHKILCIFWEGYSR
jgi:hypothetical protein